MRSVLPTQGQEVARVEGGEGQHKLTCGWKKAMAMACLVLVVRTVSCFQWPSYVSGLYTEYGVVLHRHTERLFLLKIIITTPH